MICCLIKMEPISLGFKYLGYRLKPLRYKTNEWKWLITNFEKRINHWTYRMLSLGGRVVLIRSVLSSIVVYWFALMRIPSSILNTLHIIIFSFLWGSSDGHQRMHLVSWHSISAPYDFGGWNIKQLDWFGISLKVKIFWQLLNGKGI